MSQGPGQGQESGQILLHGCALLREGSRHSVYINRATRKSSTVPRHREINDYFARKICKDLEIPEI